MTGIHQHAILARIREDEEPSEDSDLRRREPDALCLVHQRGHPLGQAANVVIDSLDLPRLHAEHGVAVLSDPREREHAPGFELELLLVRLVLVLLVVLVFVIVIVLGVVVHRAASLTKHQSGYLARSQRLRIDVDHHGQPVAAHRRRGRGEQRRGTARERSWGRRLRDQLGPMPAAQPKERRRAEQAGARIGERVAELAQRPGEAPPARHPRRRSRRGG